MPFKVEFKPVEVPLSENVLLRVASHDDVSSWERTWREALVRSAADDSGWDWEREVDDGLTVADRLCVAATSSRALEGLMSLGIERSRISQESELVYVEYVAVAPWNRRELARAPKIRGVGKVLVRLAVEVSFDVGLAGRIGLHSKPASEAFYRDGLGLIDLGAEVVEDG